MQSYTALTGGSANDSAALQAALDALAPLGTLDLYGDYSLAAPVVCLGKPVIVNGTGSTLTYRGPAGQAALTFGNAPGDRLTFQDGLTLRGLRLVNAVSRGPVVALRIQNAYCPLVEDLAIRGFDTALQLVGDGVGCSYGRFSFRRMKDNRLQIHCLATGGGFVTEHVFQGPGNFSYNKAFQGQPCCHLLTETQGHGDVGSLRFEGCSFEAQDEHCQLADVRQGQRITWHNCRFETIVHRPMPLTLSPRAYRCVLVGNTNLDVLWQDNAPPAAGNLFLPYWK